MTTDRPCTKITTDRGEATATRVDLTIEANEMLTLGDALAAAVEGVVAANVAREYRQAIEDARAAARAWRAARAR